MEEENYKNIYAIIAFLGREGLLDDIYNVTEDLFIYSVAADPDEAEPRGLLICEDGDPEEDRLEDAAKRGVRCYISDKKYEIDIPGIVVKDVARASACVREFIASSEGSL